MSPRHIQLQLLQQTFSSFVPFLRIAMKYLGFDTSQIQEDIAKFLEYGPANLMVQAQRGQAKTTITAIFAVWYLIHHPKGRVLIVSAGGKQANEISTLIVRLILNMPILECLRPDTTAGDRVSVEAFDIHYALKGIDKSPSVACIGITGNLQGKRADLLIADDVESQKNARTPLMREVLLSLTKDFSSICQNGRIVYLGTPQTDASIYNTLPARGFKVQIWPGRYPTNVQIEYYGGMLAPYIRAGLEGRQHGGGILGDQGIPVDKLMLGEEVLQKKELDQGAAYFQLQHMLCTLLSDEARYPLKSANLVVMRLADKLPAHVVRGMTHAEIRKFQLGDMNVTLMSAMCVSPEMVERTGRCMYIDPAGGGKNGDETAWAVVDHAQGTLYLREVCGMLGGYNEPQLRAMAQHVKRWNPSVLKIEKNMGNGAYKHTLLPYLRAEGWAGNIEEDWASGQKEIRIAETLEPIMGRGALIIDEDAVQREWETTSYLPLEKRKVYSFWFQLAKLTRQRDALVHDDRLDAVCGAVRHWIPAISIDAEKELAQQRDAVHQKWVKDPMLYKRYQRNQLDGNRFSTVKRGRR